MFLFGKVLSLHEKRPLGGVHILNKTTSKITVSDAKGYFRIPVRKSDKLIMTSIGYGKREVFIRDSILLTNKQTFHLKPQHYMLENVNVGEYQLSGYTDIDVQLIPNKEFAPDINIGIPRKEEVEKVPRSKPSIFNPADLLYDIFGSTPQQIRMVEKIRQARKKAQKLKPENKSDKS